MVERPGYHLTSYRRPPAYQPYNKLLNITTQLNSFKATEIATVNVKVHTIQKL